MSVSGGRVEVSCNSLQPKKDGTGRVIRFRKTSSFRGSYFRNSLIRSAMRSVDGTPPG